MNRMNKKGSFWLSLLGLGAGPIAVIGTFLLLIVAALLIFLSVNKFAVIGTVLVGMTLFIGLRGDFSKVKAFTMFAFVFMGILFVSISPMLETQFGPEPDAIFLDSELGLVSMTTGPTLVEQSYFKSTSGNAIDVLNIGDRVQVCDVIPNVPGFKYTSFKRAHYIDGSSLTTLTITDAANANAGKTYCASWGPREVGEYEVASIYTLCPDIIGPVQASDCITRDSRDTKRYFLTVLPVEASCDKTSYLGDWKDANVIDNGLLLEQNAYRVTDDCTYVVSYTNVMTTCNDGYVIAGSTKTSTTGEGFNCVSITPEELLAEQDPECDTNLIINCNGEDMLFKTCVNGFYQDTNTCDDTTSGPTSPNPPVGCDVNPDQDRCDIPEDGLDEDTMKLIAIVVIGIGAFAIIVLFGLLIARKVRR